MGEAEQIGRRWHYIRQLNGDNLPKRMIVFDTETFPQPHPTDKQAEIHKLRLWCATFIEFKDGEAVFEQSTKGKTIDEFWSFVKGKSTARTPLWLICHNAGFDTITTALWWMVEQELVVFNQHTGGGRKKKGEKRNKQWRGFACLEDPPVICKMRFANTRNTIILCDSFNWFRCSVEELGLSVGYAKLTMPAFSAPDDVWEQYCWRDVHIVSETMRKLIKLIHDERLGGLAYTVAGQAMNAYRARFMQPESILVHANPDALELERDCYKGGLAQCWYLGYVVPSDMWLTRNEQNNPEAPPILCGPVYALDAQSFYPSIMREMKFPAVLDKVINEPTRELFKEAMLSRECLARVRLNCDGVGYPVRHDGHTMYAVGDFWVTLCGPELKRAYINGHIRDTSWLVTYHGKELFTDFVDWCWNLRKRAKLSNNHAWELFAKLLANSLFGKFGQWRGRWADRPNILAPIPLGHWFERFHGRDAVEAYRSIGWLSQELVGKAEHADSCPAIAAWVTAYGRERVLQWRHIAGVQNCLYSDTDSLHCTSEGFERLLRWQLLEDDKLGSLRLVGKAECAHYRGQKDYDFGGKEVIAGVKHDATKLGSYTYEQREFQGLNSHLQGDLAPQVTVRKVRLCRPPGKVYGRVRPDGYVQPIILGSGGEAHLPT